MIECRVPDNVRAMPLARYLARAYPMLPTWTIRQALKNRDVRVNGLKVAEAAVSSGDEIKAFIPDKYLDRSLKVLYRENGLLVVDKPSGLPVDVDSDGIGDDTALSRARLIDPNARLCHRLDAGTGGVLILATDEAAYENALAAFRGHEMQKRYECVVLGGVRPKTGELVNYLRKDQATSFVKVYDAPRPGSEKAVLYYETLESAAQTSRLAVILLTGKTHQIRVQFAHIGHPRLGDDKYGDREANKRMNVQNPLLWCREITYNGIRFTSHGGVKCI